MDKEYIEKKLLDVQNRMRNIKNESINEVCKIGIIDMDIWEWSQGIGLYGLYQYDLFKNKPHDYIISWFDNNIKKGLPEKNVNTMCPMLTLSLLGKEIKNEKYMQLCKEWAEWVYKEMDRTKEGGIQHIVTGEENHNQVWIDTLFMTVLFLANMGKILDKPEYIKEAEYQFLLHIKYLYDKKTGLWFHGWTFDGMNNFAEALWARGNCWYTVGAIEFLQIYNVNESLKRHILTVLDAQVEAIVRYQDKKTGGWHTLIDDEASYIEISATAGFCAGILKGIRLGYIDKKYHAAGIKALECVMNNISDDGTVENVSYGTGMGKTKQHYKDIPICPMTYGQSLAILALLEGLQDEL